jgi:hypothetical protein
MKDFTTLEANPIPLPVLELQKQNVILKGKNKVFEKVIFGVIVVGLITITIYTIKDAESRKRK